MKSNYYSPSGGFSPIAFLYFILIAFLLFPILGLIYAYCIWYIPFIYINFLIAAGFGFGVGFLINRVVVKMGKVRNPMITFILGLTGGLIALYFHWAVWIDLVINAGESYGNDRLGVTVSNISFLQVFSLALDPSTLWELIKEINFYGTWGFRSSTVSGTFLTIIWIVEMVIIVGIATITPIPASKKPFCEMGNVWFTEEILPFFNLIEDPIQFVANMEKSNDNSFDHLIKINSQEQDHSIFTLYTSGHNENYLSIENMLSKLDDKGKVEFDSEVVVEYIALNGSLKEALLKKVSEIPSVVE